MARGFIRVYRTYSYVDQNPVIDKVRTLIQDEGLIKKLPVIHEISGVSTSTLDNWFNGTTRSPQHATIAAVITSLGYQEEFVKKKEINLDKERVIAAKWQEAQDKKRPKTNGHKRPAKKRVK